MKLLLKKELFLGNTQMQEFICLSSAQNIFSSWSKWNRRRMKLGFNLVYLDV